MKNIRFLIVFPVFSLILLACEGGAPDEPTAAGEAGENSSELIRLTEQQIRHSGIETGSLQKRAINRYVECSGSIEVPPQNLVSVYAPLQGFVSRVNYLPGSEVHRGSLLAVLEHPNYVDMQQQLLESLSRIDFLRAEFERKKQLSESDAGSLRDYQEARMNLQTEEARIRGLREKLRLAGFPVDQLEKTGEIRPQLKLYAPVHGFVTQVNVNRGMLVGPQDLLYQLVDPDHIHIELQVFSRDLRHVREGQAIRFAVAGDPRWYEAEVHLVGRMIDLERKTSMVHGHLTDPGDEGRLAPGTFLQARIAITSDTSWCIPEAGLVTEGDQRFIFVEKPGGFEKTQVETGATDNGFVEILEPEKWKEEQVVTSGAYYVNGSDDREETDSPGHGH